MIKMLKNNIIAFWVLLLPIWVMGQTTAMRIPTIEGKPDVSKWASLSENNKHVLNTPVLASFFEKLEDLKLHKDRKVRIVQIGDSHIQAGFFTGKTREILQEEFGNAGLGFVFPYRLAKSNGIKEVQFTSSVPWEGKRNIFAGDLDPVGLSGYGLTTDKKDFALKLEVKEEAYQFNTVQLFTPYAAGMYSLAETDQPISFKNYTVEKKRHRIRSGEALSIIARRYGVSVAQIKAANGLRSDAIRAGATLVIPVKTQKPQSIDRSAFTMLEMKETPGYFSFHSPSAKKSIWLLPKPIEGKYALNGVVLEKDNPGIVYSGIGVNGARFNDFNKTNLFFDQLKDLQPDMIIVSLGTNEAFDELEIEKYLDRLNEFVNNVRKEQPDTPILLTTPPPALVRKTTPNRYSKQYAEGIKKIALKDNVAVWDLFSVLGGLNHIRTNFKNGLMAGDYIHYSQKGYEYSAEMFAEALMNSFYFYSQNKKH